MRMIACFFVVTLLSVGICFGQKTTAASAALAKDNPMPSVEDMIKTLQSDKANEASAAEAIIESAVDTMTQRMQTTVITEETVKSAVEGTLITEEVVPEVNLENAETIDTKTQRYLPRLKLDFNEFPLRRISGRFSETLRNDGVEDLEQTNVSLTNGIVRRIQSRLRLETVRFEFKDRTAHLTGTVPSERQRELIEVMLRMEPGIDAVKNDLVVEK